MSVRTVISIALVRLGLRDVLPRQAIERIRVVDNHEPLVPIVEKENLLLRPYSSQCIMCARQGVVSKLEDAVAQLPKGYQLLIIDAYRSMEQQRARWKMRVDEMRSRMPHAAIEDVESAAVRFTARPSSGGSGHQAGAALDVTLANLEGVELNLGTQVKEADEKSRTNSTLISSEAAELRAVLMKAMTAAGFVNYPMEWWHFSYGDRMWAAYSRGSKAIYGPIDFNANHD